MPSHFCPLECNIFLHLPLRLYIIVLGWLLRCVHFLYISRPFSKQAFLSPPLFAASDLCRFCTACLFCSSSISSSDSIVVDEATTGSLLQRIGKLFMHSRPSFESMHSRTIFAASELALSMMRFTSSSVTESAPVRPSNEAFARRKQSFEELFTQLETTSNLVCAASFRLTCTSRCQ